VSGLAEGSVPVDRFRFVEGLPYGHETDRQEVLDALLAAGL
jgi:hypothetical protein